MNLPLAAGRAIALLAISAILAVTQTSVAQKLAEQSPPSLIVTPSSGIAFSGPQGGPFSPSLIQYRISASIGTVSYSIRTPAWLTASSTAGDTDTRGITIMLMVNASALSLLPGTYGPAIGFMNVSNGRGTTTRSAKLIVGGPSLTRPTSQAERGDAGYLLDSHGGFLLNDRGGRLLPH